MAEAAVMDQAQASQKALTIVRSARAELQNVLLQQEKDRAKKQGEQLAARQAKQDAKTLKTQQSQKWMPEVGEQVFLPKLQKMAKVVKILDASAGQLSLQVGVLKINASVDEIRKK